MTELGDLFVDGRDHDLNGTLVPQQGTVGVSTTQTLTQSGSSDVVAHMMAPTMCPYTQEILP